MPSINELNAASIDDATAMILPFIERSPDTAARVAERRPFVGPQALIEALGAEIFSLDEKAFLDLVRGHPVLAPAVPDTMTSESQSEQARLGLIDADAATKAQLAEMNRLYNKKFGFPFVLALHQLDSLADVMEAFMQRLGGSHASEVLAARAEIASVSRARVYAAFSSRETIGI